MSGLFCTGRLCSHHSADWVERELYPGLTTAGLRVCIHTVHWQVGRRIPTQIVESVTNSRKTLIVLTSEYTVNNANSTASCKISNSLLLSDLLLE